MKRLEVKIGEAVKFQVELVAVEDTSSGGCSLCWFEKNKKYCDIYQCDACWRVDGKNIYFAEK